MACEISCYCIFYLTTRVVSFFKIFFFVTKKVVRLGPVLSSDGWNILIDVLVLVFVLEYL